jgi:hypothetical protein
MTKDEALKQAIQDYMAAFGQALDAHGIAYRPQQMDADRQARKALAQPEQPNRQPLTDERIAAILKTVTTDTPFCWRVFARAIEAAHDIKAQS